MMDEIPKIIQILNKLLPIIFPIAMLPWFIVAALILTANAGALEPKATIIKPTTNGEIPDRKAIAELPFMSQLAPK